MASNGIFSILFPTDVEIALWKPKGARLVARTVTRRGRCHVEWLIMTFAGTQHQRALIRPGIKCFIACVIISCEQPGAPDRFMGPEAIEGWLRLHDGWPDLKYKRPADGLPSSRHPDVLWSLYQCPFYYAHQAAASVCFLEFVSDLGNNDIHVYTPALWLDPRR